VGVVIVIASLRSGDIECSGSTRADQPGESLTGKLSSDVPSTASNGSGVVDDQNRRHYRRDSGNEGCEPNVPSGSRLSGNHRQLN
jgi:hypothetical protein